MNRERWLLIISIFFFSGLGIYYLWPGKVAVLNREKTASVAAQELAQPPAPQRLAGQSFPGIRAIGDVLDEKTPWGRNPFLTEEEAERGRRPGTELMVKTIISGRPRSVATIDGRTVLVGEKVGEETVVEIRPDAVVLESEGRKRILRIREPSVPIEVKERRK